MMDPRLLAALAARQGGGGGLPAVHSSPQGIPPGGLSPGGPPPGLPGGGLPPGGPPGLPPGGPPGLPGGGPPGGGQPGLSLESLPPEVRQRVMQIIQQILQSQGRGGPPPSMDRTPPPGISPGAIQAPGGVPGY